MKRIFCLLLILFLFVGFPACHMQQNSPGSTDVSNDNSGIPPRILLTYSEEAFKELLTVAQLSDAELTEFIEKGASSTGMEISFPRTITLQEVDVLLQMIQEIGLPVLSDNINPDHYFFGYRPDVPVAYFYYDIDGVRYRFVYNLYNGDAKKVNAATERMWPFGNDEIAMYRENDRLIGYLYKTNYMLTVIHLPLSEEKVEKFASDMQSIPFAEFGWSNATGEVE